MDKFKGTPGPWRFSTSAGFQITTSKPGLLEGSKEVCKISEFDKSVREIHANGHAISACPELLAVCKKVVEVYRMGTYEHDKHDLFELAWDALEKANGINKYGSLLQ